MARCRTFVVDRRRPEWFGRCRRAWDLERPGRRRPGAAWTPSRPDGPGHGRWPRPWPSTTSRACGPGTAPSCEPLVVAAYDRAGGPPDGRPLLEAFRRWAAGGRPVHARSGSRPTSTCPCPIRCARRRTWPPRTGDAVRYRDRIHARARRRRRAALARRAPRRRRLRRSDDELALDERAAARVLGLGGDRARTHRSPASSTPSCGSTRRAAAARVVPLRHDARSAAPRPRLGRGRADDARPRRARRADPVVDALRAVRVPGAVPRDEPGRRRRGAARAALPARPPDMLEEGRLGGMSWGMGRGAAPPHSAPRTTAAAATRVRSRARRWRPGRC